MDYVDEIYNNLIEGEYFTIDELELITAMCGYSIETLNDAIWARYGYRNYQELMEL